MTGSSWLIMPVEVKHREFLSRIVLASGAINRGFRVLLGKDTMIRRLAPALPGGIIFDKSLGTARHGKPQRFNRLGHTVVVLDEESTGFYGSPEQFLSVRLANETLEACKRWYCISDAVKGQASKLYPNYSDRFMTTGLLRTDTWRGDMQDFYQQERSRLQTEYGPFILFDSNFGGIIHAIGGAFVKKQIRGQKKAYSEVEARMAKIFEQGRPNLEAFIVVLPKVAEWFPGHRIVIRPHPSETITYWRNLFGGNNRFVISNDGVATPWILASDIMFHHGCTTGIEASILGKPNVMYAPFPDDHHETEVMESFVPVVRDEDGLKMKLQAGLDDPLSLATNPADWDEYYSNLTGPRVTDAILDDIEHLSFVSSELPERLPLSVRLRIALANRKRRSERERSYMKQKWPGTSVDEIRRCMQVATNSMGIKQDFSVSEVFEEVFEIKSI